MPSKNDGMAFLLYPPGFHKGAPAGNGGNLWPENGKNK